VTESTFTRCPGCATVFRITAEQLAFREGQVRCGHCRAVFDANDHFVSLDAAPPPDAFVPPGEEPREASEVAGGQEIAGDVVQRDSLTEADGEAPPASEAVDEASSGVESPDEGTPTAESIGEEAAEEPIAEQVAGPGPSQHVERGEEALTDESADIRSPDEVVAAVEAADPATAESSEASTAVAAAEAAYPATAESSQASAPDPEVTDAPALAAAGAAGIGATLGGPADRFQWKRRRLHTVPARVYAGAAAALVAGLLLQLVLEYRDAIAAYVPGTRPLLATACKPLGCTIGPLRDGAALSIDASDLQADPAHRGLLLLSATIRNRAGHAIAFPYLELMLTDASDRIVVRRAFPPAEYASGSADLVAGIPPNGEHVVRMFLDASATQQAGYRVYLFYP